VHHAHFSAFRPIARTPMEDVPAAPALREHRLYQASHLLSGYGFAADEMPYEGSGNLPLATDPKTAWALAHPERFPVEVRTASYEELVRVPGIGPLAARRIVEGRRRFPPARGRAPPHDAVDGAAGLLGTGGRGRRVSPGVRGEPRNVPLIRPPSPLPQPAP
jgi:hypothetical protein